MADQPAPWRERFAPVVLGLRHVLEGGRLDANGRGISDSRARRFLGWSLGPHWLLPSGDDD